MRNFTDKVAFVTGGASGIGYGLVQNFLGLGMKVVAVDFNPAYLQEKRKALAGREDVHFVQADVGDREQLRSAAEEAVRRFGKIHVLCNNAGVGGGGDTHEADFEAWDRALRINLGGVVNGVKIVTPLILAHGEGGHIVNTSSMAGIVPLPLPGLGAYQTAKFAVRGLTESLRLSLAPHGIGVSCLFPGGTRTRIIEVAARNETERAAAAEMTASWMDPVRARRIRRRGHPQQRALHTDAHRVSGRSARAVWNARCGLSARTVGSGRQAGLRGSSPGDDQGAARVAGEGLTGRIAAVLSRILRPPGRRG